MFYANSGAGASLIYPGEVNDGTKGYTSIGCDWMNAQNPVSSNDLIKDNSDLNNCHSDGEAVVGREYNPLERGWCRDQALRPNDFHATGPYLDAWTEGLWLLTFGT